MIKPKDITVTTRAQASYGETEVVAFVQLKTVARVCDLAPREAVDCAKGETVRALWHSIYGELIKPLRELQIHAQMNCDGTSAFRVRQLCDELNALLTPPR